MDDVTDRMVIYAMEAYERYMKTKSADPKTDFNSFAVGYFMGALAAAGKTPK